MPDYSKGKIYIIRCTDSDDVYIGSTIQSLSKRMTGHRVGYKLRPHKCTSSILIGRGTAYIELVEDFPCENVEQLRKREGEVIRSRDCVNRCVAGRSKSEYREENRDTILKEKRVYHQANKEKENARSKKNRSANREKINTQKREAYQKKKEVLPPVPPSGLD